MTREKCPECGAYLVLVNGKVKCSSSKCKYKEDAKSIEFKFNNEQKLEKNEEILIGKFDDSIVSIGDDLQTLVNKCL